jgi:hypothetical protein
MSQTLTVEQSSWARFSHAGRSVVVAGILLAMPALAIGFLGPRGDGSSTAIAAEDDPVTNGFNVVEPPLVAARAQVQRSRDKGPRTEKAEVEVLLNDWTYTGGGNGGGNRPRPSPGH